MSPVPSPALPRADAPVRVMIVDDAIVVRGLIARWLTEAGGFEIVATHRTGRLAVDDMERAAPDIVILDIEMPDMDGIEALPLILRKKPGCSVIMASTLTRRNAEISLKCLSLGALDYIPKPDSNSSLTMSPEFKREVVEKVRLLGQRGRPGAPARRALRAERPHETGPERRLRVEQTGPAEPDKRDAPIARAGFRVAQTAETGAGGFLARQRAGLETAADAIVAGRGIKLRPFPATPPRVIAIGSSTGGPQALDAVLGGLARHLDRVPVLIVQHMPATFTAILAEHLGRITGRPATEGQHGEPVLPGHVYVAPGGRHMSVRKGEGLGTLALDDGPLVNFCKPAVDPLFLSAAATYGPALAAVVLTGMGSDGASGVVEVSHAGGSVIAQDEATSVVWGMPGAAAHTGHCSAVLPLKDIAPRLIRLLSGDRA